MEQINDLVLAVPIPAEEVGYARVSDKNNQDPDFQIALLKARGIPDANIFVDTASGRTMDRPQLDLALKLMAGRPGWTLVVYKLDRLGRNTRGLIDLADRFEKNLWNLVSLTEHIDTRTAMGRAFFTFMSVFAQLESDLISERTRAGIARRTDLGFPAGRKPKLSLRQFGSLEIMLLNDKSKTVADVARHYDIAEVTLRQWFPAWRERTQQERDEFRLAKPFPEK